MSGEQIGDNQLNSWARFSSSNAATYMRERVRDRRGEGVSAVGRFWPKINGMVVLTTESGRDVPVVCCISSCPHRCRLRLGLDREPQFVY